MVCFQREPEESVPGCQDGGDGFESRGDYCVSAELVGVAGDATAATTFAPSDAQMALEAAILNDGLQMAMEETSAPAEDTPLTVAGQNGDPASAFPLGLCQVRLKGYSYHSFFHTFVSKFVFYVFWQPILTG